MDFSSPSYARSDISSGETLYNFNMVISLFISSSFFSTFSIGGSITGRSS